MKNCVSRTVLGRGITVALIAAQVTMSIPASVIAAAVTADIAAVDQSPPPEAPKVTVNRRVPRVTVPPSEPQFSASPTVQEIFRARVFSEPVVPVGREPTAEENAALARALLAFHRSGGTDWRRSLGEFLMRHPASPWRPSLLANIGVLHLRAHSFSRALEVWDQAWTAAKDATDVRGRAVADSALAEWLSLAASFGLTDQIDARFATIADRKFSGRTGVTIARARETAALIRRHPDRRLLCGPEALLALFELKNGPGAALPSFISGYPASSRGTSLDELVALASRAGLALRRVARTTALSIPVPAIVHLKIGHFMTVVARDGDKYQIRDRARGEIYWMTRDTLLEETSGYFLIGTDAAMDGWRIVEPEEATGIMGRGPLCPDGSQPPAPPPPPPGGDEPPCPNGMPVYRFHRGTTSLIVEDIPAWHTPARGPAVPLGISYHHREATQPQIFAFSNMGPKWAFNWVRYLEEVPMDIYGIGPARVLVMLPPGGSEAYVSPNTDGVFPAHWSSRAVLVRVSTSPLRYERRLPDRTVEVYGLADGAPAGNQRVYLTDLIDPVGQRLQFTWDSQLRLVAITDALGQVSTITYQHATDPLKITKVTDPFGRSATFTYNAAGQLASTTDVLGLTSEFTYGANDFITALKTPYGITSFRHEGSWYYQAGDVPRFVEATDSLGGTEHLEYQYTTASLPAAPAAEVPTGFQGWNANLDRYNSFYWSKRAWALGKGDLTKAEITHWMTRDEWDGWQNYSYAPHSIKRPLENRIWYAYPGQVAGLEDEIQWLARPSRVGRVLDDGTSQVTERTYHTNGHVLSETDPLGRQRTYTYSADGMDLLDVRQTTGGTNETLATFSTFTALHQPQTITDAAGQTTTITYNSAGQVLTVTNAKQETTTFGYDSDGKLTTITGALAGAVTTIGYDGYARPRAVTASDGYLTTTDYDVFDRRTRVTYPDGTYDGWTYDRLDLAAARDRLGRLARYYYDALRRLTATRDPLGRVVTQEWCGCGALEAIVDPNGNRTSWERDLQSRVTREVRPNGSATTYTYEATTSRLTRRTDAKGQNTNHEYFADGALKQVSYTNATIPTPSVSLTYDATYGRLATMIDGIGTTTYTYRPAGQLGASAVESIDGPFAEDTQTYGYDELGRVVTRTLNGVTSTSVYDALGRLATQGDPIGTFAHAYDGATGRLTSLTYPNGQTSTYAYFPNSGDRRLQEIHHKTPTGGTLSRFAYTYDAVGNIATWTQQYEATTREYDFTYDAADELTGAVYRTTDPTPTILKRYGYSYDPVGNRTTEHIDDAPRTWTYDTMNRMTSQAGGGLLTFTGTVNEPAMVTVQARPAVLEASTNFSGTAVVGTGTNTVAVTATDPSGNTRTAEYEVDVTAASDTFTYDANGNLTGQATRTYEWDAANRLVRVVENTVEVGRFEYDGFGRRAQKAAAGTTRTYVYDSEDILEDRITGGGTSRHVHGPAIDQPLGTVSETGTVSYYVTDQLGSVVQATNVSGIITLTRQYDPFGNPLVGATESGYAFTGREWDAETALQYHRARYYRPAIGRFLSADPAGLIDGPNLYRYSRNAPVRWVDPDGRNPVAGAWAGGTVGSLGGPAGTVAGAIIGGILGGIALGLTAVWLFKNDPIRSDDAVTDDDLGGRNPAQDKRLTPGEIRKLKESDIDPEELKGGRKTGSLDLFKDKDGNIYIKPKNGSGPGESTGININSCRR